MKTQAEIDQIISWLKEIERSIKIIEKDIKKCPVEDREEIMTQLNRLKNTKKELKKELNSCNILSSKKIF